MTAKYTCFGVIESGTSDIHECMVSTAMIGCFSSDVSPGDIRRQLLQNNFEKKKYLREAGKRSMSVSAMEVFNIVVYQTFQTTLPAARRLSPGVPQGSTMVAAVFTLYIADTVWKAEPLTRLAPATVGG